MIKVYVKKQLAGSLFKPESNPHNYQFGYDEHCRADAAVSLSMPVVNEQYVSDVSKLHPIFDMNMPEGALAERLHKNFSKIIPNFDALAMLKIVGKSQIGRLRYAMSQEELVDVPMEDLDELLMHDGTEGLFNELLNRYAVYSGVSGAMPKVMVRATPREDLTHLTIRGATHIVKAWADEYPRLAENEYFCMRAALHANLEVPKFSLSKGGKFLVVERFDIKDNECIGFEDFCVLNGKNASQKYDGSYESITKRIKDFVSPEQVRPALESFFKALALSFALKNGDAHLKNFGVLYDNSESTVRLSPIYDIVTTTVYNPKDVIALTFRGTKRWPSYHSIIAFATAHCNLTESRALMLLKEVKNGMLQAVDEMTTHMRQNDSFREVGAAMLPEWNKGLNLSLLPEGKPLTFGSNDTAMDEDYSNRGADYQP